jgi:hypothetical protein
MQAVRKTFFSPLATSKTQIREILAERPVGSAHPFSPERILLCRTDSGIDEIDISSYPEGFFFNAVDLGEMGETLMRRMASFPSDLSMFMSSLLSYCKLTITRCVRRFPDPTGSSVNIQGTTSARPNNHLGGL